MDLPIAWTDLTSDTRNRATPLQSAGGNNVFCVFHHAYNRLVQDSIALFKPGGKQVTATFAIGPTSIGGPYQMVRTLNDNDDPYTTASWVDRTALTAEVSNLDLNYPYPVGQDGKELFAQIIAYANVTYGMPIDDYHVLSHREAYERDWGSYATACPGDDFQGAKAWMLDRARQIVAGGGSGASDYEEGFDMKQIIKSEDLPGGGGYILIGVPAASGDYALRVIKDVNVMNQIARQRGIDLGKIVNTWSNHPTAGDLLSSVLRTEVGYTGGIAALVDGFKWGPYSAGTGGGGGTDLSGITAQLTALAKQVAELDFSGTVSIKQ